MYPYLDSPEEFQFATPLKKFCMEVLGLTHEQCYGSDIARESLTKYQWKDIAPAIRQDRNPEEFLTARQVLQIVGTNLLREQFYKKIWSEAAVRVAVASKSQSCVLTDCRFVDEVEAAQSSGHKVITVRLYRETGLEDSHASEKDFDCFDAYPNQRKIRAQDEEKLYRMGFEKGSTSGLWVRVTGSNIFKYLVDNNSDFFALQQCVLTILKIENLLKEPNLS